ncbi:MAG TPA: L-aspartate oxidase [Phycisphaerae bacterium]
MANLFDTRRYLTDFDAARTGHLLTDVLVIGTGVAGARAAIEAAQFGDVILITKAVAEESVTRYAQGGIASAMAEDDSVEQHRDDTLRVGAGLSRRAAVDLLVREGPRRIAELIEWGIHFDMSAGAHGDPSSPRRPTAVPYALTREGGHTANRILHSQGDATGRELAETLLRKVRATPGIRIFERCFLIDLITLEGRCVGAVTYHPKYGHQLIWARQTILASGGCGQVYRETTNPPVATGDGMAVAFRAGAELADMEMMQFHPTTLYVAGSSRALISEAVRGEGAWLVNRAGERFMQEYHPDAELAPRDVVSRAIVDQMARSGATSVFLDVRHIPKKHFEQRFPYISRLCRDFDIDVARDLIPVRPSAHYMIGGVLAELDTSTSVPGLLACGEAACSGVHGANRLASNSLLEGLVFGTIAGQTAGARLGDAEIPRLPARLRSENPKSSRTELDLVDIRNSLRSLMWRNVGIERHPDRLTETREIIEFWGHYVLDKTFDDAFGWETQNLLTVARLIATGAAERRESRGVHFRRDFPEDASGVPGTHTVLQRAREALRVATAP